jgi:hypothetical protein
MLNYDKEYGQCPKCTRAFVISVFNAYPVCNYDRATLTRVGQDYPQGVLRVGA